MGKNPIQNTSPLVGTWKLISFAIHTEKDTVVYPFGEDAEGQLMYDAVGRISAQLMRKARPRCTSAAVLYQTISEERKP